MVGLRAVITRLIAISAVILPFLQVMVFSLGVAVSVYLYGNPSWLYHSLSYLATSEYTEFIFSFTLFVSSLLGFFFILVCLQALVGKKAFAGSELFYRIPFYVFTLAYASITISAFIPTTPEEGTPQKLVHWSGAVLYFILFPLGALLMAKVIRDKKFQYVVQITNTFVFLFSAATVGIIVTTGSYVLAEIVAVAILGVWSIHLGRIVSVQIRKENSE